MSRTTMPTVAVLFITALVCCVGPSAGAATLTATWTGAGDMNSYTDPANWDIGKVPVNDATDTFIVVIPAGSAPVCALGSPAHIDQLLLSSDAWLSVSASTQLNVMGAATANGGLNANGATFTATGTGTVLGNQARIYAANGGTITLSATSYASTGFLGTVDLMKATGANSRLDLPSVTSFNAGFDDGDGHWANYHTVEASGGGRIVLSGLTAITGPVRGEDGIEFVVADAGSGMDLSGLQAINSAGAGWTKVAVAGANLPLPALEQATAGWLRATGGGSMDLPSLTQASATVLQARTGGTVSATGASAMSYSTAANPGTKLFLEAAGANSRLDLPSITSFDAGFDDGDSWGNYHTVQASGGGRIVLSGLTTITGPVRGEDGVDFLVADPSSSMDLSGLQTIATAGFGYTRMGVAGGTLPLPALEQVSNGWLHASYGGWVDLPSLTQSSATMLQAFEGGTITATGASAMSYSTTARPWAMTLMEASGTGSRLDLPAITSFDAGFNDGDSWGNYQTVQASGGGQIVLSGLITITGPVRGDDNVEFSVADAASGMDLSGLQTITTAGYGRTRFVVTAGQMQLGGTVSATAADLIVAQGGTILTGAITLSSDSTLSGEGSVQGRANNGGLVGPGSYTGTLGISTLVQQTGGTVAFDIAGLTAGTDYDQLQVGAASLGGTISLARDSSFMPQYWDMFCLVDAELYQGIFATVDGLMFDDNVAMAVTYGLDGVWATAAMPGDATLDGVVNVGDLGVLAGNWGGTGKHWRTADFNGDGVINVGDLGILAGHWGQQAPPPPADAPVPEPATMSLLALGALAMLHRRK